MRHPLALFAALLLLAACGGNSNKFYIEGQVIGSEGHSLYLEEMAPEGRIFIDSIPLDDEGHFSFSYAMPYPSLYNLHASPTNYLVLEPEAGEHIEIEANWSDLAATYIVDGSDGSQWLWEMQENINWASEYISHLVDTSARYEHLLTNGQATPSEVEAMKRHTDSLYLDGLNEMRNFADTYLAEHRGCLSTLLALYLNYNSYPLFDPRTEEGMERYHQVAEGLQEAKPDNPHTLYFTQLIGRLEMAKAQAAEAEQ